MNGTSLDPRAAQVWRTARTPLLLGLLVVLAGVVLAATADRTTRGLLNPAAVDDSGSRAVAQLLREQGVAVDVVRTAAGVRGTGVGATVLVPFPGRLATAQVEAVQQSGADVVLVAPGADVLAALAPGVEITALDESAEVREPRCELPAARTAGPAEVGGDLYRALDEGAVSCYPTEAGSALVQVPNGDRTSTVLGAPDVLTNVALAEEGNAALALGLLGENPRLLWFLPVPEGPPVGQERTLGELVPPGWSWGVAQLGVAAVLVALWRARRLGPVVAEPLPVVVRSAETVEGLARLYRRAGAREHAAEVLRAASRTRLAPLLGLGRVDRDGAAALVAAVAARTGRPAAEVDALLYGPAPVDDNRLVALADGLDACTKEVRRS